ncbi:MULTISPECIES: P-type DNA transfer protein VirB5 [unclassified Mesorhizobium]|uniref:P-type DNA transfer protein VirB5 n=1 Tax=unclassified Mesorhizobium TaxID=325217 RepID=UPI001125EF56|nr:MULTISPECIES: P-type DNA transfer protein VirB5 [unclassified Mesorhizobium]MBZ9739752.1 P-type DNA transfer protein VirB5 [Mesorhizobium sp. CO1-1-4]MBZ9804984.1 P-type DNA transfer protein VirB5 [Mesorhizobium sp. ES1-6]TPL88725.1 P-type DNA transfer protein VirB5 [Mesorhizobium sp. B2-3-12]
MRMRNSVMAAVAILAVSAGAAGAQGIPVIDKTAILQWASQLEAMKEQFDALNKQIAQAEQLHESLNKLTKMADVASLLNQPEIRKALPQGFAAIEGLLNGNGSGVFGDSASKFLEGNSTYQTSANDFYARELARIQHRNAGQMSLGQQIYDAATKRIDGIDQLRQQISSAGDAKDIADLQARIQAESAFLQTDLLRMQGLQMVQQAQAQVEEQRKAEDWRKRIDTMNSALAQ